LAIPRFRTYIDVVRPYIAMFALARSGAMRNAPPESANLSLTREDLAALVAFLQSLTEDDDAWRAGGGRRYATSSAAA
jgi:hypothetical protein